MPQALFNFTNGNTWGFAQV